MKTNYLQKNSRQALKKKSKQVIFIIILILVLFFFGSFVRGAVQLFNTPINAANEIIVKPINSFFNYFYSKNKLAEQNKNLDQENKKLKIELLTIDSLRLENDGLKKALGYERKTSEYVLAKVLNKPPVSPYDTLVIDLGEDKSIVGQKVFYENLPIGYILEVYKNSSVVKMYSSSNEKIYVNIGEDLSNVEAVGIGNGAFKVEVPKDINIENGEIVTLPNNDFIGLVQGFEAESSNTFQNIYFKYPFMLKDMDFVLVRLGEL